MIKYTNNSLLASLISFSNEIAGFCEVLEDVDVTTVLEGVYWDRRLSPKIDGQTIRPGILTYLKAGCGFGGSCFPKDVSALEKFGLDIGVAMPILRAVLETNHQQPIRVVRILEQSLGSLRDREITVLGLAFKPDTDDIRESPAMPIIEKLLNLGAKVRVHDPAAMSNAKSGPLGKFCVKYGADVEQALKGSEAVVVVTAWPEYMALTSQRLKVLMKNPLLIDGRRVFSRPEMESGGIQYCGVGLNAGQRGFLDAKSSEIPF